MAQYELILGLRPDLSASKQKKILEKIKDLVSDASGKVEEIKSKGLARLAYPVTGFTEAYFTTIFFTFEQGEKASERSERSIPGEKIKYLQKELKSIEEILRMMFLRKEVKR